MTIASVLLDVSLPKALDYEIPKELLHEIVFGSFVEVPLRGKNVSGWVVGFKDKSSYKEVKPISALLSKEPGFTKEVYAIAEWVASYYMTPLTKVLKTIIPSSLRKITKHKTAYYVQRAKTKEEIRDYIRENRAKSESRARVLETLLTVNKEILLTELCEKAQVTKSPIETLAKNGFLKIIKAAIDRSWLQHEEFFHTKPKIPNLEQKLAIDKIVNGLTLERFETHLIYGVTGSGKTEVYMQAIEHVLKKGGGVLVMVPEIALTAQGLDRFKGRFKEKIAVLHHRLSDGERFDGWHSLRRGETRFALGARSSIFAPVQNLKLIIVDEEHEASYKQSDEMPCYHARDVAVMRGKMENAVVVLGSATPSLESYTNARQNKYILSVLQERAGNSLLPKITIVDMLRAYEKAKGYTIFSEELIAKILERKKRGEQSILFLNRRGYHTSCLCLSCKSSIKCKHCDQAMTFHKKETILSCHLCGFTLPPSRCPQCNGSTQLKFKGIGTESVENALKAIDPDIRTLRIDADTTKHKGSHERLFKEFATQKADVLIGTQMVAKGLHFPLVTLVGVLNADQALQFPDYKAQETTFQLLTQVSGRAGRTFHNGEVIIQTGLVDHPLLKLASSQNYEEFYNQEIAIRELFLFPPFKSMAKVRFNGSDDKKTESMAMRFREELIKALPGETTIMPVVPAGHFKVKDRYFYQFFVLTKNLNPVRMALSKIERTSSIRVHVDINPISTYF